MVLANQRLKRMAYDYDFISGNVHEVSYQYGRKDQLSHRYEYDTDNRIMDVFTSKDYLIWNHDARYLYNDHASLAWVELGDSHMQGIDYAYTLQGWLKGINSDALRRQLDMGKDGDNVGNGINSNFGKAVNRQHEPCS